jgi:hypothetical protein
MSYIKRLVVLANSYKPPNGRCIAGKELVGAAYDGWIRPVSARPTEEVSFTEYRYEDNRSPKVLDIVDIAFLKDAPVQHQTENHVIDPTTRWIKRGELPWDALQALTDNSNSLWANSDHTNAGFYDCISEAEAATMEGSLYLIRPDNFDIIVGRNIFNGKKIYRADFGYQGTHHNLSVTDPVVRDVFGPRDEGRYPVNNVYLCVSLTHPYEHDGRCHKLVAAVISNRPL